MKLYTTDEYRYWSLFEKNKISALQKWNFLQLVNMDIEVYFKENNDYTTKMKLYITAECGNWNLFEKEIVTPKKPKKQQKLIKVILCNLWIKKLKYWDFVWKKKQLLN